MEPGFPGDGWTPACLWEEWVKSLFYFAGMCGFCFSYKSVFISTHEFRVFFFFIFTHLILSLTPWVREWVVLSCHLRLNHNTQETFLVYIVMFLSTLVHFFPLILLFLKTWKIHGTGGNRTSEVVHIIRAEQTEVNCVSLSDNWESLFIHSI